MEKAKDTGGLVLAGWLLVVGGLMFFLILAVEGHAQWQEQRRFLSVAKEASAVVVSVRMSSGTSSGGRYGSRGHATVPTARFVDAAGRERTDEVSMSKSHVWRKGDKLTVLYDPTKPGLAWDGPPSMASKLVGLGVAFALLSAGGILIFFFGRRPRDG